MTQSFQTYYNTLEEDVTQVKWYKDTLTRIQQGYVESIPLSNSLIEKLTKKRFIASVFHKTSLQGFEWLVKYQNTAKAVSAASFVYNVANVFSKKARESSYPNDAASRFFRGVHRQGIVCKLVGDLLVYQTRDIMSVPDSNGRRWIDIGNLPGITEELIKKIQPEIDNTFKDLVVFPIMKELSEFSKSIDPSIQQNTIIQRRYETFKDVSSPNFILDIREMGDVEYMYITQSGLSLDIRPRIQKWKQRIIAGYYDACHQTILKYIDEKRFSASLNKRNTFHKTDKWWTPYDWDEAVVNRYKIEPTIFVSKYVFEKSELTEKEFRSKYPQFKVIIMNETIDDYTKNKKDLFSFMDNDNWIKEVPLK